MDWLSSVMSVGCFSNLFVFLLNGILSLMLTTLLMFHTPVFLQRLTLDAMRCDFFNSPPHVHGDDEDQLLYF